ncbi:MAG: molybdopterin-dependent oxidoreductase, partial [Burkholderiaceae bacterium]
RRKSVSPHDGLGANLIVQVRGGKVMRMLPLENDDVNECWLSDRDRFAYPGLYTEDRLTTPRIKQDGKWIEVDWQTALEYVAHGLRNIRHEHGADAIAALAAPHSTLEELYLLQKLVRGLGSDNVDFRLRQSDFSLDGKVVPWLGMPVAGLSKLDGALIVGSTLRQEHPLLAARLRQAAKRGAKIGLIHASDDDLLMPVAARMVAAPSSWVGALGEVIAAVAATKGVTAPEGFENVKPSEAAKGIAAALMSGESRAILLGNAAAHHPEASRLHAAAEWLAANAQATFGYLAEAANSVGGYLVNALPSAGGANALQAVRQPRKAYVLMNLEAEADHYDPAAAVAALRQAEMVISLSPYAHGAEYADVMLPISPFSETAGTFVNAEGRAQSFNGAAKPFGDTRPGWKVLRVLGNLLDLHGFDYENTEAVRKDAVGAEQAAGLDLASRLNNAAGVRPVPGSRAADGALERLGEVPMYATDAIVRRSPPLQDTRYAHPAEASMSPALAQRLGVVAGDRIRVEQGSGSAVLHAHVDARLPDNVIRIPAAIAATASLGGMFGPITAEKV